MPEKGLNMLRHTRIIMFLATGLYYLTSIPDTSVMKKIILVLCSLAFVIDHILLFKADSERETIRYISIDFLMATVIGLVFYPQNNLYIIYYNIIGVTIFFKTSNRRFTWLFMGLFILIWETAFIRISLLTGVWDFFGDLLNIAFVLFGCLVGYLIRELMLAREKVAQQYEKLNASHQSLKEAHEQLSVYAKQVEELTSTQERNRIAREIHDTVGHKMTALLIQLQLAKELIIQKKDNGEQTIETCETIAREALQEIRRSVQALRSQEQELMTFQDMLRQLLEEFSKMAQIETTLEIEGDQSNILPSIQPTLKRVIQESLTNAVRHGNATSCRIHIVCSEEKITCHVQDNGKGDSKIKPGFGLVNMRERVSEHGGKLRIESESEKGFILTSEFPLKSQQWQSGGIV